MNTVSFEVKASPFLAFRTVRQLGDDEGTSFPLASEVIKRNMYVDYLVSSVSLISLALDLYSQLIELFHRGDFQLVK